MTDESSVAMTGTVHRQLADLLLREDGQEDLCMALYRPSTGRTRRTALLVQTIPPRDGERHVHGNVSVTDTYVLRAIIMAQESGSGVAMLHSHPLGRGWQAMSRPDFEAERAYANLVRETTGLPLVGMTLAGANQAWSTRHWDQGVGARVAPTHCENVRVVGDTLDITWNPEAYPPPKANTRQVRSSSAWGEHKQADLARQRVIVVGLGSVGLDVALRMAASGVQRLTLMDFDRVEHRNLDRLIGATREDANQGAFKADVAAREARRNATAASPNIRVHYCSICEPEGLAECLDHDLIFSCVDRSWPRAVLNALAYSDLIPVIDGGIAIDTTSRQTMRNATWRSHVVRPGRPCMVCSRQLDMNRANLEINGLLDDPTYLSSGDANAGQNVAPLSISVAASLLAQYVSFTVRPGCLGDPGPLQYHLNTHWLEQLAAQSHPDCIYEPAIPPGDARVNLTGRHEKAAEIRARSHRSAEVDGTTLEAGG